VTLQEALQSVYDSRGRLTPAIVVEEAKKNRTAAGKLLRTKLEWDDAVAGEKYRIVQAQELIQSVRVTYREATETEVARSVRGFHAIQGPEGYVYEPLAEIVDDEIKTRILLQSMEREWKALHRRYGHFREFVDLVSDTLAERDAA
jgi:hypothetical protein